MKQPAILLLAAGLVLGVAAGSWLPVEASIVMCLGLAIGTMRVHSLGWVVVGLVIGLSRVSLASLDPQAADISELADRHVETTGVVRGIPERRPDGQRAVVEASSGNRSGKILAYAGPEPRLRSGDQVRLRGRLTRPQPFDGFDYPSFLAKDGVFAVMYRAEASVTGQSNSVTRALAGLRFSFQANLARAVDEPAGGFLLGILLGERDTLSDSWQSAFQRTGTTHVLALSGYNISILIAVMVATLGRRAAALGLAIALIMSFVLLVGPSASVVRAAAMGSFILVATVLGRPQAAVLGCVVTAAAMLLVNPWSLRYDLAFDLSFAATLGILLLEPGIRLRLWWLPRYLKETTAATVAASLPTVPLVALSFGSVSVVAPLANALVVPAVPWLMLGGFVVGVTGYVSEAVARTLALVVGSGTEAVLVVVDWLAGLPWAAVALSTQQRTAVACSLAVLSAFAAYRLSKPIRA